MKIAILTIFRIIFIGCVAGTLGVIGISPADWQFWTIIIGALGLYTCGLIMGAHDGGTYETR